MTITGTVSAQELLALFRAELPDVEDGILSANAEVIAESNPEAARVVARVLSASKTHEGSGYPIRLIRDIIITSSSFYGSASGPWSAEDTNTSTYISAFWSTTFCTELARIHAFQSTAHVLKMSLTDLIVSEATTSLLHNRLLTPFRTDNLVLSEGYWRGVALLHVYIRDEAKRDALTPVSAMDFVRWVGEQDDFKAAADLFMERQSIDAQQLDALMAENNILEAPLRTGAL